MAPLSEISQNLPAWLSSLVWHLSWMVVLGLVTIAGNGLGDGSGSGVAIYQGGSEGTDGDGLTAAEAMSNGPPIEMPELPAETPTPLADVSEVAANALETLPKIELQGLMPGTSALAQNATQGDGRGQGNGRGDGQGDGDGVAGSGGLGLIPVRTKIFDIVDEGTRFVYVFDRSESMNSIVTYSSEGSTVFSVTPLSAAKAELLRSLDDLNPNQRFQIVFYNHRARVFEYGHTSQRMLPASKTNKYRAAQFVNSINGEGWTHHLEPLEIALRLKPDVVFLLTDGEAKDDPSQSDINKLTAMNRGRSKINVIHFCFGARDGGTLAQLAHDNGGQHVLFNISRLGPGLPNGPGGPDSQGVLQPGAVQPSPVQKSAQPVLP